MPVIQFQFQGRLLKEYPLSVNTPMTVGRLDYNTIAIENIAVSGSHARIVFDDLGFFVEDLGSKNGTFVNNAKIQKRRLQDGDTIRIGKHDLVFVNRDAPNASATVQPAGAPIPDIAVTGFLDTSEHKSIIEQSARLGAGVPLLLIRFKERMLYKHLLRKGQTRIGRNPGSDIVIDNVAVSDSHAILIWDHDGFRLTDSNSSNGTFVNRRRIESCVLHDGDAISIGKHELLFEAKGKYTVDETHKPLSMDAAFSSSGIKTTFLDTGEHRAMMTANTPSSNAAGIQDSPRLVFLKGGEGEIRIQKKVMKIGKDDASDIVVHGMMVGKTAALITARPDGFYLSYNEGLAKPHVNGNVVKTTVKLNRDDIIEIGSLKLQFKN